MLEGQVLRNQIARRTEPGRRANRIVIMNQIQGFDIVFPREYLRAALIVSLLSVWVLVGLF